MELKRRFHPPISTVVPLITSKHNHTLAGVGALPLPHNHPQLTKAASLSPLPVHDHRLEGARRRPSPNSPHRPPVAMLLVRQTGKGFLPLASSSPHNCGLEGERRRHKPPSSPDGTNEDPNCGNALHIMQGIAH